MPARLPRRIKELGGTLRKCRDNPNAPRLEPSEVPPPPRGMKGSRRRVWLELKPQVEALRVYDPAMFTSYRLLVTTVAAADDADGEPSSARARLVQCAQAALASWGLRPADRERVSAAPEPRDSRLAELLGHDPLDGFDGPVRHRRSPSQARDYQ